MPRQTVSQQIGRAGERWFAAALPTSWVLQPPLDDVGLDGVVVICDEGPLNGQEFRVQIKTSRRWPRQNGDILLKGVKRDSVLYWLTGFTPTLLVLYETSTGTGLCVWANRLFARDPNKLAASSRTMTIRIPGDAVLTGDMWPRVTQELAMMNWLVGNRVVAAGKAIPLMRSLRALADALLIVDFVTYTKKGAGDESDEDRRFLRRSEVVAHRQVVRTVTDLDKDLRASGYRIDGLADFARAYSAKCATFIEGFDAIVDAAEMPADVTVNVDEMIARRSGFVRSVLETMVQLTELGLNILRESSPTRRGGMPAV